LEQYAGALASHAADSGVSMVPAGKYQKGDVLHEKLRRTGRRDPLKVLTAAQMLKAYHD